MAAISVNHLTDGASAASTNPVSTASITPTAGKFYTVAVVLRCNPSATANDPTISGCNLTFTKAGSKSTNTIDGVSCTTWIYYAVGSPTTGTISLNFGAQSNIDTITWFVDEWSNVDLSGTNGANGIVQQVGNTAGHQSSFNVTLAALANSNNVCFGNLIQFDVFSTLTAGSGQNTIKNIDYNAGASLVQWKLNSTVSDVTSDSSSFPWTGVAVELKFVPPSGGFFQFF